MGANETSERRVAMDNIFAEIVRIALLRLNHLHAQMVSISFDTLLVQEDRDHVQMEYDSIKQQLELRMPGFTAIFCNECKSHGLMPAEEVQRGKTTP